VDTLLLVEEVEEEEKAGPLGIVLAVVVVAACSAGAIWLAVSFPGSFAYWLAPLLMLPAMLPLYFFLYPWNETSLARKVTVSALALLVAGAGGAVAILNPEDRSWVIALLALMPFCTVLVASQSSNKDSGSGSPDEPSPLDFMIFGDPNR
jgi:peptidoglycan/LPS O-acetylase OafA/YrhL